MGKGLRGPRTGSPASSFQRRTCSAVRTARIRPIAGLLASWSGFPDCISRIWPKRAWSSIARICSRWSGVSPSASTTSGSRNAAAPLRLEGDLLEPDALRWPQDRVDLRLVGAGLSRPIRTRSDRAGRRAGLPKASLQRAAARAESSITFALWTFVEVQVVACGRLNQQIELPGGAEDRQVGEDRLDPPRGVAQLGLRIRVAAPLGDELAVVGQCRGEQTLAQALHPRPMGELFLAGPDQLVDRPTRQPEPRLGLVGTLMFPTVGRLGLLLLDDRPGLLATDDGRADQRRGREQDQRHHAGPDDRRVPPRPGPQPFRDGRPTGEDRPALEEPLEVVGQLLRRRITVGRLLAERLEDDGLQPFGDRRVQRPRGRGLFVGDLPDQGVAIAAVEGGPQREQLVERRAERIDVAAVVDDPATREAPARGWRSAVCPAARR